MCMRRPAALWSDHRRRYLRPFGTSVLIATYDKDGPELYQVDPSGVSNRFFATATGKAKSGACSELEKVDFEKVTVREALSIVAKVIYKLHDDVKDKEFELDLSWVCDESGRKHVRVPEELRQKAIAEAKAEKDREEMADDDEKKQ